MATGVQFNPGTLKASYNAVTSKAIYLQGLSEICDCFNDGDLPAFYTLEISGNTTAPDNINGIHQLTHFPIPARRPNNCRFEKIALIGANTYTFQAFICNFCNIPGSALIRITNDLGPTLEFQWEDAPRCQLSGEESNGLGGKDGSAKWCRGWNPGGC